MSPFVDFFPRIKYLDKWIRTIKKIKEVILKNCKTEGNFKVESIVAVILSSYGGELLYLRIFL